MDSDEAETLLFYYSELRDAARTSETDTDTAGRDGQRQGGDPSLPLQRAARRGAHERHEHGHGGA